MTDDQWGRINLTCRLVAGDVEITKQPLPEMPEDLGELVEEK